MERKLFIVRHGKSSWDSIVDDIDRPLTERGVKNSYEMADRLNGKGLVPDEIYTSPANRAMHTAIIMSKVWNMKDYHIHIRNNLYLPEISDITELFSEISEKVLSVAIFGHNPGFTNLANRFMEPQVDNVPTAGVVVVSMDIPTWNDIFNCKVLDVVFKYPKK
ncbi:MAG: histidine phosphatase family protein [Bacteroidales bacterium]